MTYSLLPTIPTYLTTLPIHPKPIFTPKPFPFFFDYTIVNTSTSMPSPWHDLNLHCHVVAYTFAYIAILGKLIDLHPFLLFWKFWSYLRTTTSVIHCCCHLFLFIFWKFEVDVDDELQVHSCHLMMFLKKMWRYKRQQIVVHHCYHFFSKAWRW